MRSWWGWRRDMDLFDQSIQSLNQHRTTGGTNHGRKVLQIKNQILSDANQETFSTNKVLVFFVQANLFNLIRLNWNDNFLTSGSADSYLSNLIVAIQTLI